MADSSTLKALNRFGSTQRHDAWWVEIIPALVIFTIFIVYATIRAFQGKYFEWGPYLSPFYSPLIDPEWLKLESLQMALELGVRVVFHSWGVAAIVEGTIDMPMPAAVSTPGSTT